MCAGAQKHSSLGACVHLYSSAKKYANLSKLLLFFLTNFCASIMALVQRIKTCGSFLTLNVSSTSWLKVVKDMIVSTLGLWLIRLELLGRPSYKTKHDSLIKLFLPHFSHTSLL